MSDPVTYQFLEPGVGLITFNRPERLNAWTAALGDMYFGYLDAAMADPAVRAAILAFEADLRGELNVKAVEVEEDDSSLVEFSAKANFKTLGKKLGKRMKDIATACEACNTASRAAPANGSKSTSPAIRSCRSGSTRNSSKRVCPWVVSPPGRLPKLRNASTPCPKYSASFEAA